LGEKYVVEQLKEKVYLANGNSFPLFEITWFPISIYFHADAWLDKGKKIP